MIASYLLRGDFEELGVGEEYAEGVIDELRAVKGVELAMTVREPPEPPRRRRGASRCGRRRTRSTSPRSPGSAAAAGIQRAAGFSSDESIEEIIEFVRSEFADATARA